MSDGRATAIRRTGPPDWRTWQPAPGTPLDQLWTPDAVADRLYEMAKVIGRTGRVGPQQFGKSMPDYVYDWGDLLNQVQSKEYGKGGNRIVLSATARQMSRAEEAQRWPGRYLRDYAGCMNVIALVLACWERRRPLAPEIKARGWNRRTFGFRRDEAFAIIAVGLNRDGIPLEFSDMSNPDRRAKPARHRRSPSVWVEEADDLAE